MLGRQHTTCLLSSATCSLLRPLGSRCLAGRGLSSGPVFWTEMSRPHSCHVPALQQSVPVTPSILDGRFRGEPASKAQYFKMGDDSLPSCLKTTDAQAACICKPHRDGKQAATVWGRGIVGVWEEGRHLLPEALQEPAGRKRPAWYNRSQHQHSAGLSCVLARAAMASVRAPLASEAKPCRVPPQ